MQTLVSWRSVLAVLGVAAVVALAFQGTRGIFDSTEGRYALCAGEMLKHGNWLEPTLAGETHWTKPPLAYWTIAGGVELLGYNAWGARLGNAAALVLTTALVGLLGAAMWDRRTGLLAALIFATSPFPVVVAHTLNTDTLLALWEALAVLCYWRARQAPAEPAARRWIVGMWAAFGLAFFTKGPPGLLPLLAIVVFHGLFLRGRPRPRLLSIPGLLLFLALGLWWYLVVIWRHPELFGYFLGNEVMARIATAKYNRYPEWYRPFTMYLPLIALGGGLWTFYLWRLLRQPAWWRRESYATIGRDAGPPLFLILWLALPFLVFSLSRSRLPNYVVPLFPVVALAVARGAAREWTNGALPRRILWFAAISAAVLIAGKGIAGHLPHFLDAIHRADPVIAGVRLARRLPLGVKRDSSQIYRMCQPFDRPGRTLFLLYRVDRCFGFEFYATSPVIRVASRPEDVVPPGQSLEAEPPIRRLTDVLAETETSAGPRPDLILVCRGSNLPALAIDLRNSGWQGHTLAETAFWGTVRLTPVTPGGGAPDPAPGAPSADEPD